MRKPSPWLNIRVANSENVKDSDEGNVVIVRKCSRPDKGKELDILWVL